MRSTLAIIAFTLAPALTRSAFAQPAAALPARPTGWEIAGIPALNFNSDEGFGYGAILQLYDYGSGAASPYRMTIQPTLFFTTRGRRDFSLFVDAPHALPRGWRVSSYIAREKQLATPYYGAGNDSPFDERLTESPNPYFYRFGRQGLQVSALVQHALGTEALRAVFGAGGRSVTVTSVPYDSGTTLLAQQVGGSIPTGQIRYVRAGLVLDTRDREVGPHSGTWAEVLVQRAGAFLGGTEEFTRVTLTARKYLPLGDRVTLAERVVVQNVAGNAPFYELFTIQSSYKDDDGLGGAGNVRGIPKDRYSGKGLAFANSELRWRVSDFTMFGKPSALVLSGFVDAGRVWLGGLRADGFGDLHVGAGGGARLALGPSFVIAADAGHSSQSTAPIYIGLGYLF